MTQAKRDKKSDRRLGELMIEIGIVSRHDLNSALQISQDIGLPVGRVLIMSGWITESQLQAAVQVQSLLKDGLITMETAIQAAKLLTNKGMSLQEALSQVGWASSEEVKSNKLGELLLGASFVSQDELEEALSRSFSTGVPFGRLLVLSGTLSEQLLAAALNAQILLRDGKISREQAVEGLKAARQRQVSIEIPLMDKGIYRLPEHQTIRLGELLSLAGLISESDLMYAVEIGLVNQKPIGRVLVELGFATEEVLDAAVALQAKVANGSLMPIEAAHKLSQFYHKGTPLTSSVESPVMAPPEEPPLALDEFLKLAGLINDDDIQKAVEASIKNAQILGRMLLIAGIIDEPTLQAALRSTSLIREKRLSTAQAFIAFNYSQRSRLTVEECVEQLGWSQQLHSNKSDQ